MSGDSLFSHIERLHGSRPWGAVLDAGTGSHSLAWVSRLSSERWTAVTGEGWRLEGLQQELGGVMRPVDRLLVGNWSDPLLLHGEVFDTVLADYLVGAIDRFAPYHQYRFFARLRPLVGGRLYVVGLEPQAPGPGESPAERIVLEIVRLRDAAILLAGDRPHREYPLEWVLASLEESGFRVDDATVFPIIYRERFIEEQLDVCRKKTQRLRDPALAKALLAHVEDVRARALEECRLGEGLRVGSDYVIAASPV